MAAATATPRMVEKKTTFTESIPAEEVQPGKKPRRPPIFDYLPTLSAQDWKEKECVLYLYRYDRVTGEKNALEKFNEAIDPFTVKRLYGGGHFNVMMKEGPELIYNVDFGCEGEEITPAHTSAAAAPTDGNSAVTLEALRMMSNPEIMRMQMELYTTAAKNAMDIMRSQIPTAQDPLATLRNAKEILGLGAPVADPFREMFMGILVKLIERSMNPADPIESFTKMAAAVKGITGEGGTGGGDALSTLIAQAPTLGKYVVEGMREARMTTEANYRITMAQRGGVPPNIPSSQVIDVSAEPGRIPNPAPAEAATGSESPSEPKVISGPSQEWVFLRIVEMVRDPRTEGSDLLRFLDNVKADSLVDQIAQLSHDQIITLFKSDQILATVADDPRLPQLIDEFLMACKEEKSPPGPAKVN
jgi:hypothetical protein